MGTLRDGRLLLLLLLSGCVVWLVGSPPSSNCHNKSKNYKQTPAPTEDSETLIVVIESSSSSAVRKSSFEALAKLSSSKAVAKEEGDNANNIKAIMKGRRRGRRTTS